MRQSNRYLIAVVAALGLIPVVLDTTIVTVALGPIRGELHTDVNSVQWIVTAFFLTTAAVVVIGGYLANRFGRKRMFILGLAIFTLGSVLCGLSPGIGWLIAFRVLQGIGGGVLTTIGVTVAFDAFPKEERAKASAVVGVPALLAPIFGPILGGYLNDTFSWHSIFFVNLPVGIIAIALALVVLPRDVVGAGRGARFDYIGLALSMLGVIAIVYAFTLVTQTNPATVTAANPAGDLYGWGYWLVWALLGAGIALLMVFAFYSLRVSRDPALDLRQFGRYDFLMSNLFSWAGALITFGLLVLLPLYFELVRLPHLSALDTGLALVPLGAGSLVGVVVASALYRLIGPRWVVFSGAALAALSAWQFARIVHPTAGAAQILASAATHTPIPAVAGPDDLRWWMFALGLGFMMINISVQTLALEALKGEALAKATSLVASTKLIFSSIGVAILTTILTNRTRDRATDLLGQIQALADAAGISPSNPQAAAALRTIEAQLATQAGTWAIQGIFWLICFGTLGLIALALLLPGRRRTIADAQPASEDEPVVAGV
ncbi:MAG TPA: DHA2 family efflux MFS transporter permease subunit [Ktedonobacterales bacterium]|nr:DHA2 family efflux MFS transporter permease subunit [Ktedonobacterales bacterium]